MLFQHRFHPRIRDGSITLTFRVWKEAKVRVGGSYRLGPEDAVEVRAVDVVTVGSIGARDARRAGFADADGLVELLRKHSKTRLTARSRVFRVRFRHVRSADPRAARRQDTSRAAVDQVRARLERMDRLSRRGPWTREVLALIAKNPRVAASKLAPRLGRETRAFKADVRKLKELGLTESHEVGYTLSPRGRALLKSG